MKHMHFSSLRFSRTKEMTKKLTLQIWDTAGQERFRFMAPMYYRNAKAAISVFDLSHEQTFEKIKEWLQDVLI